MSQDLVVPSCSGPVLLPPGVHLQQTRTDSSWMLWRKPGLWEDLLPPEEKERAPQIMFVWSEVDGGSECWGETPAARLTEVSRVPTQRAAPALASSWVAPSLKHNRVHRVTRGSTEDEGGEERLDRNSDFYSPDNTVWYQVLSPQLSSSLKYICLTLPHTTQGSTDQYIHTCISQWGSFKSGFVMWPSWNGLIQTIKY